MTTAEWKLSFSRFEFKYVLPRALRDDVEAELGHFVELDPFVADRDDHRYLVRSLYFDSPDFACFHDKIDGMHTRSKFRIRTYGARDDLSIPQFLEVKGRYDNLVFKHRVPLAHAPPSVRGEKLSRQVLHRAPESPLRWRFEFDLHRRRIRPYVLVDYRRRPYVSRFDPEFRLTFDEELSAIAADTLFPPPSGPGARALVPGYTVMEVKFRYHVPSWFHRIIQAFELRRRSFSKVCVATSALELAVDLS